MRTGEVTGIYICGTVRGLLQKSQQEMMACCKI